MCRAQGAWDLDTRTQRLPFDSAQGKCAGLTSDAPTALTADRSESQSQNPVKESESERVQE